MDAILYLNDIIMISFVKSYPSRCLDSKILKHRARILSRQDPCHAVWKLFCRFTPLLSLTFSCSIKSSHEVIYISGYENGEGLPDFHFCF